MLLQKVVGLNQGVEWVQVARLWQYALAHGLDQVQVVVLEVQEVLVVMSSGGTLA